MKVLIISNEHDNIHRVGNPIIGRIVESLNNNANIDGASFCPFFNNLKSFWRIRKTVKQFDIVHIQFGGLYAFLIWFCLIGIKKPKLLTFHGTDIHAKEIKSTKSLLIKLKIWLNQKASFCSILIFDKIGFVSDSLISYLPKWIFTHYSHKFFIQPLGVDYKTFMQINKDEACKKLGIINDYKYVLFSDKSGTILKRRDIAEKIVKELGNGYKLLIMCGVKPDIVPFYINASDFVLLTSDEEGSPNITREALSLNKRVFSVDVGDVRQQLEGLVNSAIISRNPKSAASTIQDNLSKPYIDNTRESLKGKIDFENITKRLVLTYQKMLSKKTKSQY